ncbi:energy-coupling factor transporter ATPase [Brevibacillus daliensis]|uniref:energy-coupling factor transporter ATPase n=1 Tax=Brevibacillus daliensis TaxID=2892995 RepID=UPI001E614FEC|nr:energy-coupling factor transporter ATPase [Brevibacillus daliensis]
MAIVFHNVTHAYQAGSMLEETALQNISFSLDSGSFTALIGPSGSGKSTLIQHCNGLLLPTSGQVHVMDFTLEPNQKTKGLRELRKRIGLVFQFPEHQLFAETVEQEITFGPKNFGATKEEALGLAKQALHQLDLDESILNKNPFQLSGGQMRKVAIASILAMDPDILILDEPTATLDPVSRRELLSLLHRLCKEQGKTILLVTHRLDEVLAYADKVMVLKDGRLAFHGTTEELSNQSSMFSDLRIRIPSMLRLQQAYRRRFPGHPLPTDQSAEGWAKHLGEQIALCKMSNGKEEAGEELC